MKKRIHFRYCGLLILCLLLLASCDSQSDEDTNEITATFRPIPSGEVVPDYEMQALGTISISKDQAVPLSRLPHRSFSIADDETKAAPNPRLTAVFIASIEFNFIITLNCLV